MEDLEATPDAPQIIPPTDFGMSDEDKRLSYTRYLLSIFPQTKIEETAVYDLYRAGSGSVVHFFMLEKPHGRLVYFVKCETANLNFLGPIVTQVSLWRDDNSIAVDNITKKVFGILLDEWPTIMSDEQQTASGGEFWRRRMAMAASTGLRVGLADMRSKTVDWRDPDQSYRDWIEGHKDAWSTDASAQNLRFVISRAP